MKPFDFQKVFDFMAKPMDGQKIPSDPFGPFLMKIIMGNDDPVVMGSLTPKVLMPFFLSDEGIDKLEDLIAQILGKNGEDFCLIKMYECPIPDSPSCLIMSIHHKGGVKIGYMNIDKDRVLHGGALIDDEPEEDAT